MTRRSKGGETPALVGATNDSFLIAPGHTHLDDGDGLLNWARLQAWIADSPAPGDGPVTACSQLAGGTQNNLFMLTRADSTSMVLRRPPRHPRPNSNETILREARVLAALSDSDIPHPAFLAVCANPAVIGTCFHLGEAVDGFNPAAGLEGRYVDEVDWQRSLGRSMIDSIASLSKMKPADVGLTDLGRPDGWIERQVPRWRKLLDSYTEFDGYPGANLPGIERVGFWLEENQPNDFTCRIIHGDFHLANVLARHDRPELAAIVDWELTTLGDPRLDLAWLLATSVGLGSFAPKAPGFPSWREMVDHYADHTGLSVDNLDWWWTLACYKLGIILEGTNARAMAGRATVKTAQDLHQRAIHLFEQAENLIDGNVV
ncbi:MAG: phosphotransferase family protein [Acidimicrobiales bacterium]|nr:phosphotransferase family protein [Acidimicrobiales bacterium]